MFRSFRDTCVDRRPIPGGNPRAQQGKGETLRPPQKLVVKTQKLPGSFMAVQCRQDPSFTGLICNDLGVGRLLAFPDLLCLAASVLLLCCTIYHYLFIRSRESQLLGPLSVLPSFNVFLNCLKVYL